MHSKQALAVLALAASTATPVLSAPLPENQERARAEFEEPFKLGPILKTIGINAGLGAIPAIIDKITGSNQNAARELAAELDERGLGSLVGDAVKALEDDRSIGKVLSDGVLGGVASGIGSVITEDTLGGNNTRREPEPLNLGGLGKLLGEGLLGGVWCWGCSITGHSRQQQA